MVCLLRPPREGGWDDEPLNRNMDGLPRLPRRPGDRRVCPNSCPCDDFNPVVFNLTVYDDTPEFIDTGLVSPEGDPILRPGRDPIGFLWSELPYDTE